MVVLTRVLSSCLVRGEARWLWRLSKTAPALRHASDTPLHHKRQVSHAGWDPARGVGSGVRSHGRNTNGLCCMTLHVWLCRLDAWTREEVAKSLREVEEVAARGGTPCKKNLALLLAPIRHFKDSEGLVRVLEVMRRANVTIDNGVASALVVGLAEAGWAEDMRTVLREMQGQLRLQGTVAVLSLACRERDVELAKEYLEKWDVLQPLPLGVGEELVRLAVDAGHREIVEAVFRTVRNTGQKMDEKMARALQQWAAR